uniref:Uncharacterized protein n=1 Tax=Panagrolaimus sp. PS1159 TaxID=55785 RepID=A0AC35F4P5_9BILA
MKIGPIKYFAKEHSCDKNCPLDYEQFGKYVEYAAKKGSKTAQVHMEIWKYMNEALEAFKKNDSAKVVQALSKAIRLNPQIVQIPNLYIRMIEARVKEYPNELDAIICQIQVDAHDAECKVKRHFIDKAFKLFPGDKCLAVMLCKYYYNSDYPKLALEHVEMALKRHPRSLPLLFWHICILYTHQPLTQKLINALQAFLAAAPEDHPNVPACHYYKAEYYAGMENMQKLVESFADGLAAEKKQLPCFLPYEFGGKRSMVAYYNMAIEKINNRQRSVLKEEYSQESRKVDPKGKYLISQNRGIIKTHLKDYGSSTSFSNIGSKTNISSNPSTWPSFKNITLKDMDLSKEKIYKNFVLEAQIID